MKKQTRRFLIRSLLVLLGLLAAESIARAFYPYPILGPNPSAVAASGNALFVQSPEFWPETHENHGLIVADTQHGHSVNVQDGYRVVLNQTTRAVNSLYLFGASQMFGLGVPDTETIPFYVQDALPSYRVVNQGGIGWTVSSQWYALQRLTIKPGDVVVWYDGTMDAAAEYQQANQRVLSICQWVSDSFRLFALAQMLTEPCVTAHLRDTDLLTRSADTYQRMVDQARQYVIARGGTFYHFLEPTIFSVPLSPTDRAARCGSYLVAYPQLGSIMTALYQRFSASESTINLMHALDILRQSETVYLDCYHVNGKANAVMAQAIVQEITPWF